MKYIGRDGQKPAVLEGRFSWLLKILCSNAGIDDTWIDPMLDYWENKSKPTEQFPFADFKFH